MQTKRFLIFLLAPLALNVILFVAYRLSGLLHPARDLLSAARRGRETEILVLIVAGFCTPALYVAARTRLWRRSMSAHEVALLVFLAWLVAESSDIFSIIRSGSIPYSFAVFKAAKIAVFAVAALFTTAYLVSCLQRRILHEVTSSLDRSRIFVLFSLAYTGVTGLIIAVNWLQTNSNPGALASIAAVVTILMSLNLYGLLIFRMFYRQLDSNATDYFRHPALIRPESGVISAALAKSLARLDTLAASLDSRHVNAPALRSELKAQIADLRRLMIIEHRAPDFVWAASEANTRLIDRTGKRRFLIATDDGPSLGVLQQILAAEFDCTVDAQTTGRGTIHAALAIGYDVMFIDIGLKDPDAFGVTALLRQAGITAHIIALSGTGPDLVPDARSAGMNAYLEKPFDRTELLLRLEQLGAA
ncbi:MAG: response regulator [Spirochaetota bacterium]